MKKHYHHGKAYWQVRPIGIGRCEGCAFASLERDCPDHNLSDHACFISENDENGDEIVIKDVIWIPATNKGMTAYVAAVLGATDENEDTS